MRDVRRQSAPSCSSPIAAMDRFRSLFQKRDDEPEYEPLNEDREGHFREARHDHDNEAPFSWVEYGIFALLGVAMLWAWNMFLAAAPYFQSRFQDNDWVLQNFQSAIISVSTITNLTAMTILTNIQYTASYPFRINTALYINIAVFALLTLSTMAFVDVTPGQYLGFLLVMVAGTAWAAGLIQNGAFAFASSFGRPEYMQAIMAGQGVAGVLPPVAQIISVLVAPPQEVSPDARGGEREAGTAAFIYFLTAVIISAIAILSFIPLVRRHNHIVENRMVDHMAASMNNIEEAERAARKVVSMTTLFKKLRWLAAAVFMCFVIAMFFPIFTPKILSVTPPEEAGSLLQPAAFIPLGFFFWNLGDLGGRSSSLILPYKGRPAVLFAVSLARTLFLPLYALCNIHGKGAVIRSDVFYLLLVQFPFGLTNGWLASNCMMAAGEWVDEGELEASGGFMGLCLVAGLAFGSLLSFTAAGI
ncbi:nucleoside transporter [Pseudomassariella vexata]|uniref:Nucleoside transporter n=1 Tax=Pseudomassariella vexata TaxID=1141098 RepID=A0A1Y2EE38_9PEZI|nr:nucleoside transporter [Pseudomassariella vexata]ORY69526.1 nucleoside transporter [Pseudomassariella vexata]